MVGALAVTVAGAFVATDYYQPAHVAIPPIAINASESAGMCPWRNPVADMQAFFPGSDRYEQHLLIMSDLLPETLRRLGPGSRVDANGIYCYRIYKGSKRVGVVLAQRTPGEYGVVEYAEGIGPEGKIAGLRIQRLREPAATKLAIESPAWLGAFIGNSSSSRFELGADIPNVPDDSRQTAESVVSSVRRLTIEYDVALENGR
jgi:hypothetical protein